MTYRKRPLLLLFLQAMQGIYAIRGLGGLWHGVSAGLLKTIPKYVIAHVVKGKSVMYSLHYHAPNGRER